MYISNNKFRLTQLTRELVEPCAKLLAEQFIGYNDVWVTMRPTLDQAVSFMHDKTHEMLDWEDELKEEGTIAKDAFINFAYLDEND
jgi:hypothetical protein